MLHRKVVFPWMMLATTCVLACSPFRQLEAESPSLPTVKFFYYDAERIEWYVSAEPEKLANHLAANPQSERLLSSTTESLTDPDVEAIRVQMAKWIETERGRYQQGDGDALRFRMAEGILAYCRAHDFDIGALVSALKRRSGASEVELVAVHLADRSGNDSFKLKVVLLDSSVDIGKQGFNIELRSSAVTSLGTVYALGLALYEVHEIINADAEDPPESRPDNIEILPLPSPSGVFSGEGVAGWHGEVVTR